MSTRSAEATIKGYYYQFDASILSLLNLSNDTDAIEVEGIEDIDINTATEKTAIQCKYLSTPRFINSAVREPITLMLEHFVDPATPNDIRYILYAHFEDEVPGGEPGIDLARLKEILTYSEAKVEKHFEIDNSITDAQLIVFLSQFKFCFGREFSVQQKEVVTLLRSRFGCSEFEADAHFYNNALRIICDLSIKKDPKERKITKLDFIRKIDCRMKLFNEWFILLRSKKEYLKLSAQNLKSSRAIDPSRTKMIVLGTEIIIADNSEMPMLSFIENLIAKYYKLSSALHTAKPLTFVFDCNSDTLTQLKKDLIDSDIPFNDGCEEIKFSTQIFNKDPIKNTNKSGIKILKSSYLIRIVSKDTLQKEIAAVQAPSVLINLSREANAIKFPTGQFFDFNYCENLKDVYYLLTQ